MAGCVLPEPIFEEPPPAVPDEGILIEETIPSDTTVTAISQGAACNVTVELPEVLYPGGANPGAAPVFARFFLNLNNPNASAALTIYPLAFEGSADIRLQSANTEEPTLISLPSVTIDLSNYEAYLTQPTAGTPQPNTLEVVVSDGFSDNPTQLWLPVSQASEDPFSWYIDLTNCPSLVSP
jgi:hypothetical protein